MTIRRVRISRLLKLLPLFLCFTALYWIGIYLLGPKYPSNADVIWQPVPEFNDFKELLADHTAEGIGKHSDTAKKTLIVVSHGRSGSSIMGDIFNHHPSVFYMYEPLQIVWRIHEQFTNKGINVSYRGLAKELLDEVLRCQFENQHFLDDMEIYYRKQKHPRVSKAIASPPLCPLEPTDPQWDPSLCPPMTSESLGSACRDNYDLTVLKVLISRIPENTIKIFLTACNPSDVDCKIVFLVRDPRAVVPSSKSFGFFKETAYDLARRGTRLYSYWRCKETEDNLDIIRKLPGSLRRRIRIQRYEDLAFDPMKALSGLYKFAGLTELESVRMWLNTTTKQDRKACNEIDGEQATCTKDNAWTAANRWRWMVHPHEIDVTEHYCRGVMRTLGYKAVDGSYELLANKSIPLFTENYEAKSWFNQ